ncbi:cytochrome P450 [Ceratobasidium sp. AG-I]|nr:cytochrome P450 [Ceratobasidium sp. AG-I]
MYDPGTLLLSATASVLALLLVRWVYMRLMPRPIGGVPHNPVVSVWGDIPEITRETRGRTFGEYLADQVRKHGPIFQILIGRHPIIVVSDLTEVERILLKGKNTDQSKRTNEIFATVIPGGQIALPADEAWRRHRRLTGPSMSKRYLGRMAGRVAAGAGGLVRLWNAKVDLVGLGGGAFDADMDLQLATMDTIVNITMGTSPGCIDTAYTSLPSSLPSTSSAILHIPQPPSPPIHLALRAMMASIERSATAAFPFLTARLIWASPTWRKHYTLFSTFFDEGIAEARRKEESEGKGLATDADCVVDMVVQRETREGAEKLGKREIVDELMTYVIAGQDTTASALAWHVKFLPQDPEIQQRLHDEVCAIFGRDGELNFEAIDDSERVPVLEAVVAETLRCAKVASSTGRELLDDEVIMGRVIPKGTQLMFPFSHMSNDESSWGPDASRWRPSRWLNPDGSFNRAAGPSIPFGLGQRSCFGQRLAILQMKMFVAALSRDFIFRNIPQKVDVFDAVELVTRQPKVCYVSLERWG